MAAGAGNFTGLSSAIFDSFFDRVEFWKALLFPTFTSRRGRFSDGPDQSRGDDNMDGGEG